jgi:hypothetical protein
MLFEDGSIWSSFRAAVLVGVVLSNTCTLSGGKKWEKAVCIAN